MRLEHLKDEYPVMPDNIRIMIESQVEEQLKADHEGDNRRRIIRMTRKKAAVIALAATMALGTTAFAGNRLYQWYVEKEGNYGMKAGVAAADSDSIAAVPDEIPVLSIEAKYLPDGMVSMEDGSNKYYYQATPYIGGVSIATIAMDAEMSADQLPVSDTYVITSEELTINDQDAIYLERQVGNTGDTQMNKKIYIAYPEYWQIVEMYIGEDVSKEEALKIAENIDVRTTGETILLSEANSWSEMLNPEIDTFEVKLAVPKEAMKNTHEIGEEFMLSTLASDNSDKPIITDDIQAKVTDVKVADDFELLNDEFVEPDLKAALDENGKLIQNDICYMKSGDGIETLNESVSTEKVNQKLVYATIEFTNTGEDELKDIMFGGSFIGLTETADGYTIYDRAAENSQADYIDAGSVGGFGEMDYYDTHGGERNNNYIPSLAPGETVTVHIAKVVNEDEMDKMYLSLDTDLVAFEFTDEALQIGYVDIRQ